MKSFSAQLQVSQGRFRDVFRVLELALEDVEAALEPYWTHFKHFHEPPYHPMVEIWIKAASQRSFSKDVLNKIIGQKGSNEGLQG